MKIPRFFRSSLALFIYALIFLLCTNIYISYFRTHSAASIHAAESKKPGGRLLHTFFRSYRTDTAEFSINGYKFLVPRNEVETVINGWKYQHVIHTISLELLLDYPSLSGLTRRNADCLGFTNIYNRWNLSHCENAIYFGIGGVTPKDLAYQYKVNHTFDGLVRMDTLKSTRMKKDKDIYIYHFTIRPGAPSDAAKFYGVRTYLIPINANLFEIMRCSHTVTTEHGDAFNNNLCMLFLYAPPEAGHPRNLKIEIQFSQDYQYKARKIMFDIVRKLCAYVKPGTKVPTFCALKYRPEP